MTSIIPPARIRIEGSARKGKNRGIKWGLLNLHPKSGKILASLPLQFGGIVSTDSFETVSSNFEKINNSIVDLGCKFTRPHLIPLFLPFLALPSIRILAGGIIDVKKRSYISPIN